MIPKSANYCLIRDGIIVAKGHRKQMEARKQDGDRIGQGFSDGVGTDVSARLVNMDEARARRDRLFGKLSDS